MSRSWSKGSTRRWRKTRAYVLARDGHVCKLALDGCTFKATHVHHTGGRAATGDDPALLVASCQHCNLRAGDPTRTDPAPTRRTRW